MVAFRRVLLAGIGTLVFAGACTSITIPSSIPPITIPSIPPINVPGFTIPPIVIPGLSIPPGTTPCTLVTSAEVSQILGSPVTDSSDEATTCTFILPSFTTLSVQADSSTDLSGVQFLLGNTAQQLNVGGYPALSGTFIGLPVLYVQKPSGQLQVLGFLTGTDPTLMAKLQQIATIAVGRMP